MGAAIAVGEMYVLIHTRTVIVRCDSYRTLHTVSHSQLCRYRIRTHHTCSELQYPTASPVEAVHKVSQIRPPRRRDPSTPPPDGYIFPIHEIIELYRLLLGP